MWRQIKIIIEKNRWLELMRLYKKQERKLRRLKEVMVKEKIVYYTELAEEEFIKEVVNKAKKEN